MNNDNNDDDKKYDLLLIVNLMKFDSRIKTMIRRCHPGSKFI